MRRALAAGLLACALAAHAQTSPEPAPPAPQAAAAQNPPATPPPHPPKASAPRPPPAPAPEAADSAHEAEVAALRAEVNRLQSELDAERAAALPPNEEAERQAQSAGGSWGWLVATALLALAAGFLLGWRLLDRRIRRKYGGLRIY